MRTSTACATTSRRGNRLGLQGEAVFATPYPGTEWYQTYKASILEQYGGNLEEFLLDLGDATKVTAVISKKFNAVELYGLRELMVLRDVRRIDQYEREWNRLHANTTGDLMKIAILGSLHRTPTPPELPRRRRRNAHRL